MPTSYSPLRYPGGKQKLFKYIVKLMEVNELNTCTYIEPFAGGGGLALRLLFENKVDKIVLNDIDRSIYAVWYSILYNTEEFCAMIKEVPVDMENWYLQKQKQVNKNSISLLELGFSTFFLNRTNRSGIIKGGVIGGKNQEGRYKLDCRFNKTTLIERIEKIAEQRERIMLYNLDAIDLINNIIPNYGKNTFVFLDPPYYNKGPGLYENHYKHEDHLYLSQEIYKKIKCPWIVTYDYTNEIKKMYDKSKYQEYSLSYSAQNRYKGTEVMFYSKKINPLIIE